MFEINHGGMGENYGFNSEKSFFNEPGKFKHIYIYIYGEYPK